MAAEVTAALRFDLGRHPDDPLLHKLIGDLPASSTLFAHLWAERDVNERCRGVKRYRHPVIGELTVTYQAMAPPGEPGQTLTVYTVPPGSPDEQTLRRIVSWAEEQEGAEAPARRFSG